MSYNNPRYRTPKVRTNEGIRSREVRVIGSNNAQMGVMDTLEAIRMARNEGLDLIEIAPNATPPVCRIMDFGKFRYEQSKKEKDQNKSKNATKLKEIKFRVRIDQNDYLIKLRRAEEFLLDSNKVKLTMFFRNREANMTDVGMEIIQRAIRDLAHVGTADAAPRQAGRNISTMMSPLPAAKRKAKYTTEPAPEGAETDDSDDDEQ